MILQKAIAAVEKQLGAVETRLLFSHSLNLSFSEILINREKILSPIEWETIQSRLQKRLEGIPLQYLLEEAGFWKSSFAVGEGVLIPRPETELLVERLLQKENSFLKVAELGAGSGNIGISVLQEKNWEWHAFECNPKSMPYVQKNKSCLLPKSASYFLYEEDFFEGAKKLAPLDGVVSNPPYIAESEIKTLEPHVQKEPWLALDGGKDGLKIIRHLVELSYQVLKPGGFLILEIGFDQSSLVEQLFKTRGFSQVQTFLDLAKIPRVVEGVKPWTH